MYARPRNRSVFIKTLLASLICLSPALLPADDAASSKDSSFTNSFGMKMISVNGKKYYLAATELTQGQWVAIMGENPSGFKGDNLPVETVSWDEAVAFCKRLTAREQEAGKLPKGYVYALPSEKQWEYACRAGTTEGDAGPVDAMAWYDADSTKPVGTKKANSWGFHDMLGNVWEWCGDSNNPDRPFRGGCWYDGAKESRPSQRRELRSDERDVGLGFRPALVPSR
jgi:sulfatase modifying factor 1